VYGIPDILNPGLYYPCCGAWTLLLSGLMVYGGYLSRYRFNWLASFVSTLLCLDLCIQIIVHYLHYGCFFFVTLVCYDRCGHCFVLSGTFFLFVLFFGSCYWSSPMNSRSDREDVLTAVTSAPKLPYNKDDRDKRMRMYLPGL
jgi:hypothetical protein